MTLTAGSVPNPINLMPHQNSPRPFAAGSLLDIAGQLNAVISQGITMEKASERVSLHRAPRDYLVLSLDGPSIDHAADRLKSLQDGIDRFPSDLRSGFLGSVMEILQVTVSSLSEALGGGTKRAAIGQISRQWLYDGVLHDAYADLTDGHRLNSETFQYDQSPLAGSLAVFGGVPLLSGILPHFNESGQVPCQVNHRPRELGFGALWALTLYFDDMAVVEFAEQTQQRIHLSREPEGLQLQDKWG